MLLVACATVACCAFAHLGKQARKIRFLTGPRSRQNHELELGSRLAYYGSHWEWVARQRQGDEHEATFDQGTLMGTRRDSGYRAARGVCSSRCGPKWVVDRNDS